MLSIGDSKKEIIELVSKTESLIPEKMEVNLPPFDELPDVPQWHNYETEIWELGEKIRQILNNHILLRKDKQLLDSLLRICLKRNAKRGRQPFILLFTYKHCNNYAPELITQLDDEFVSGQVIEALTKMQAGGFAEKIEKFTTDKNATWIKSLAKKYIAKFQ